MVDAQSRWVYRDSAGAEVQPRTDYTVARQWNEAILHAIRNDLARPTVHARNIYHATAAMWDAWAAYDDSAQQLIHYERMSSTGLGLEARREAMSYACFRILNHRFSDSPGADICMPEFRQLMLDLGYDPDNDSTEGHTPAALGNRVARSVIEHGLADGANELEGYANRIYQPQNRPLPPGIPAISGLVEPNCWQPLAIQYYIDQGGNVVPSGSLTFLSPEWGWITPFALTEGDRSINRQRGVDWPVYLDPGPPPLLGTQTADEFRKTFEMVAIWSSHLDHRDGVIWDISPRKIGNAEPLDQHNESSWYEFLNGGEPWQGYEVNPVTGKPYPPQWVPRGDFVRVVAEYWADGPHSETPPGHWFVILNYVTDHPGFERTSFWDEPHTDDLEWDIKAYITLAGAMHDAAIAAWSVKGCYDYVRPISALRYMASLGQSSDPAKPNYHPDGISLYPGLIEQITHESSLRGERHWHLRGFEGQIAVRSWRGPDHIFDAKADTAGVDWVLLEAWWPYQLPSFVTPPFAGYVSGHSTFSRAAAEVLTVVTGSPYFPEGIGEFLCEGDSYLKFEKGPSVDVRMQWVSFVDAANQSALSRIWGGIHPGADDLPARRMGMQVGYSALQRAIDLFVPAAAK
ncbi:MAG: vanadium-dependent haloperoxidase [Phycisphaerales bacterium]